MRAVSLASCFRGSFGGCILCKKGCRDYRDCFDRIGVGVRGGGNTDELSCFKQVLYVGNKEIKNVFVDQVFAMLLGLLCGLVLHYPLRSGSLCIEGGRGLKRDG